MKQTQSVKFTKFTLIQSALSLKNHLLLFLIPLVLWACKSNGSGDAVLYIQSASTSDTNIDTLITGPCEIKASTWSLKMRFDPPTSSDTTLHYEAREVPDSDRLSSTDAQAYATGTTSPISNDAEAQAVAAANADFQLHSGSFTIASGQATAELRIPMVQDCTVEAESELFQVLLSQVSGAALAEPDATMDSDGNPIDVSAQVQTVLASIDSYDRAELRIAPVSADGGAVLPFARSVEDSEDNAAQNIVFRVSSSKKNSHRPALYLYNINRC